MAAKDQTLKLSPEVQKRLKDYINSWKLELIKILPILSKDIEAIFDNRHLISFTGTGGFALSDKKIALSFDPDFQGDKKQQIQNLKGMYFHECYHAAQGFTDEATAGKAVSAIENAIYEGAATVFERDRAGTNPLWGRYEDKDTMIDWVEEIKALPLKYDRSKYKFYDPSTGRRWIMYKVGAFLIDETLRLHPKLDIEDLTSKDAYEILRLAGRI